MMVLAVALTVIGSMMNSNKRSNTGVLLAVAGIVLAFI
jgi:hypothetical protein